MRETIHEYLHRRPFRPFEIHLSNGEYHVIRHPDFAELLKNKVVIGLPDTDQTAVCFLLHVAEVRTAEPLIHESLK
jgi:hypothetical protein